MSCRATRWARCCATGSDHRLRGEPDTPRSESEVSLVRFRYPAGDDCKRNHSATVPAVAVAASSDSSPLRHHELNAWRGLLEVHARVSQELDAQMQAHHGLPISAYEVLMFLADAPDHRMRMSDIAERVLLSRSGCTRLVDRLVKQGFVTRCAADSDGRGLFAALTPAGLEKVRAARPTHRAGVRRFFLDHLTPTDQIALCDIWSRFSAADRAMPSSG
jgi:DNA-binding MarR family transcriptional regulator